MDRLQQLRVFTKVVERQSLSRAARDLGVTQPTVSKALAALERALTARLLLRSTRRLTVTDAGRRYYERCRTVLDALDEADAEACEDTTLRGTLKVHGPVVLGELVLGPAAVDFQKRWPLVRCDVTCLDTVVDLMAEDAELAFRLGAVTDPSLVCRPLGTMRRLLVASPAYLRQRGTPRQPSDLTRHASVRFSGLPSADTLTLGGQPVTLSPGFQSNSAIVLRHALVQGLGIGLVTEWLVADALDAGALVEVLPHHPPPSVEVNAVFPSGRFIARRARLFVDVLITRLTTLRGTALGTGATPSAEGFVGPRSRRAGLSAACEAMKDE